MSSGVESRRPISVLFRSRVSHRLLAPLHHQYSRYARSQTYVSFLLLIALVVLDLSPESLYCIIVLSVYFVSLIPSSSQGVALATTAAGVALITQPPYKPATAPVDPSSQPPAPESPYSYLQLLKPGRGAASKAATAAAGAKPGVQFAVGTAAAATAATGRPVGEEFVSSGLGTGEELLTGMVAIQECVMRPLFRALSDV